MEKGDCNFSSKRECKWNLKFLNPLEKNLINLKNIEKNF